MHSTIKNFKDKNKIIQCTSPSSFVIRSENCTITARDERRTTEVEMKYMRKTVGNTWTNYKTNRLQRN
jgi:transcription elongation factor